MSYQVLARQWRPKNFSEVIGQDYTVQALKNAIKNQRLHHAYLFSGTRGVGKTTLARILAKSLNCEQNQAQKPQNTVNPEPCGVCHACMGIDQGNFVDLIEVDAASKTRVEDTRDLLERVQYMPAQGRYKVYLIDEVHMLSNHSFNSLLKTLEEPPTHVKFLLATTDPQKIPATVISRCLQFHLKPVAEKTIAAYLEQILTQEHIDFESTALLPIARHAEGSIRDALSLTDQMIAFTDGQITQQQVHSMLGIVHTEVITSLLEQIIAQDAGTALHQIHQISQHTVDLLSVLDQLLELLQQIAVTQQVQDPQILQNSIYGQEVLNRLGRKLAPADTQLFYQIGLMGKKDWHIASNSLSCFTMIILRMLAFKPYTPAQDTKKLPGNIQQPTSDIQHTTPSAPPESSERMTDSSDHTKRRMQPVQSQNLATSSATVSSVTETVAETADTSHPDTPSEFPKSTTQHRVQEDATQHSLNKHLHKQQPLLTQDNWQECLARIRISAFAASLLKQAQWLRQDQTQNKNRILLQLSEGHYALWKDAYRQEAEQALSAATTFPVQIEIQCLTTESLSSVSESVKPDANEPKQQDKGTTAKQNAKKDPVEDPHLDRLLKTFDGTLV